MKRYAFSKRISVAGALTSNYLELLVGIESECRFDVSNVFLNICNLIYD